MGRPVHFVMASAITTVAALSVLLTPEIAVSGFGATTRPAATPGLRIAFVAANNSEIASVDIGGGGRSRAMDGRQVAGQPTTSRLAVLRSVGSHLALWSVDVDGTNPRQLDAGPATDIAVSPDGTRVAYVVRTGATIDASEIRVVGLAGGTPFIVATGGTNVAPAWSRDSKRLAYVHESALYIVSAAGGSPRLLLTGGHKVARPSWIPGNARLVYEDQAPGSPTTAIGTVSANGGDAHVLPRGDFSHGAHWPLVSADGKWVAFVDNTPQLQVVPFAGEGGGVIARTATTDIASFSWVDPTHLVVAAIPPPTTPIAGQPARGQFAQLAVVGVDGSLVTVTKDAEPISNPVVVRALSSTGADRRLPVVVTPRPHRNRVVALAGLALMLGGAGAVAVSAVVMVRRRRQPPPPEPPPEPPPVATTIPGNLDL